MKRMWINDRVAITTTAARWPRKRKMRLKRETVEQLIELEAAAMRYLIARDRARRDGEREDGRPRFVKVGADQ